MISFHSPIEDRPSISRFYDHCFSVVLAFSRMLSSVPVFVNERVDIELILVPGYPSIPWQ